MAEKFDPYYTWLSISPEEQSPTFYRLLGLRPFEDNLDVIENAADRQMTHLRSFQSGKHSEESQKLLNEVAATRLNLLNEEKKAEYDKKLRELMDLEAEGSEPDEELSTTLAGFLQMMEAEKATAAEGKKAGEKVKPTEPQRQLAKDKTTGRAETLAKPPTGGEAGRGRKLIIGLSIGVAVLLALILIVCAIKSSSGRPEKPQPAPEATESRQQTKPFPSTISLPTGVAAEGGKPHGQAPS